MNKAWGCVRGAEYLGGCPSLALKGSAARAQKIDKKSNKDENGENETQEQFGSCFLATKFLVAEEKSDGTKHK